MREQGEATDAEKLVENELAAAVRDIRLAEGPEALPAGELQAIFVNEERRVADAVVLAELLIPQLAGSLPTANGVGSRPRESEPGRRAPVATLSPVADPVAGSPAIPDLLDAMLAADAAARRQTAGRRAH